MEKGKIKWFDPDKGYGFIGSDNGSKDIFVHISEIQNIDPRILEEGTNVEFEIKESKGKFQATRVRKLS